MKTTLCSIPVAVSAILASVYLAAHRPVDPTPVPAPAPVLADPEQAPPAKQLAEAAVAMPESPAVSPPRTPEARSASAPVPAPARVAEMPLGEMQQMGHASLHHAMATHRRNPAVPPLKPVPASVREPLALAPLPTEPPANVRATMQPAGAQVECCGGELPPLPEPADGGPANVERRQLSVAAQQARKGDWQGAHDTYRQLAAATQDELVRSALRRNLEVTEKQLSVLAETDLSRREWLELDLANTHQDLGHAQAAERIWADLEKRALHPDIRNQAASLRQHPPRPTRPVTLPIAQNNRPSR